jgi:RNA polymerase sigma factor (sigma-70 family)
MSASALTGRISVGVTMSRLLRLLVVMAIHVLSVAADEPGGTRRAMSPSAIPDADLLHDKTDPPESFAAFYRRHVAPVIRYVASRGLSADEAADVVADTFVGALQGRYRYRPEREHARLWLLAIATRRIADLRRRQASEARRHQRLGSEAVVLTQLDRESYAELFASDDERALDALVDLPPVQQEAVRARILGERDYAEIAEALGLSKPATRQHVSRGLSALRRKLRRTA